MLKKQMAYHRLEWLRGEGERLHEENKRLQRRLAEIKRLQKEEQLSALQAQEDAQIRRQQLEEAEKLMQEK